VLVEYEAGRHLQAEGSRLGVEDPSAFEGIAQVSGQGLVGGVALTL